MRAVVVTLVAASVVTLAVYGLVETERRAGPLDVELRPVALDVTVTGTYQARADSSVGGICVVPPCDARTAIDLRFEGLPDVPYTARLEGDGSVPVGPLVRQGADVVLQWTEAEDHTDKAHLVLAVAGRDVAGLSVQASDEPASVETRLDASWNAQSSRLYLNEIGGVTISTFATAELVDPVPAGWRMHAFFEGADGRIDLGPLDATPGGAILDARVERVGIEDQDRLIITLGPEGAPEGTAGFPLLTAELD